MILYYYCYIYNYIYVCLYNIKLFLIKDCLSVMEMEWEGYSTIIIVKKNPLTSLVYYEAYKCKHTRSNLPACLKYFPPLSIYNSFSGLGIYVYKSPLNKRETAKPLHHINIKGSGGFSEEFSCIESIERNDFLDCCILCLPYDPGAG